MHTFLSASYWAKGIPRAVVQASIEHSLCFAVFNDKQEQVGFARIISDFATFAYLSDVFILKAYQGKGLGKYLIANILAHPQLQSLRRIMLATNDAQDFYQGFGFSVCDHPERLMEIVNADLYIK